MKHWTTLPACYEVKLNKVLPRVTGGLGIWRQFFRCDPGVYDFFYIYVEPSGRAHTASSEGSDVSAKTLPLLLKKLSLRRSEVAFDRTKSLVTVARKLNYECDYYSELTAEVMLRGAPRGRMGRARKAWRRLDTAIRKRQPVATLLSAYEEFESLMRDVDPC
jgi:hypothetical protein